MRNIWPALDTLEDVRKALRNGGISGLVFAGMIALGMAFMFFTGSVPGYETAEGEMTFDAVGLIVLAVELALVLFLTWRLWAGRGFVSGSLLLLLFLLETGFKLAIGGTGVAWIFVYAAIVLGLVNALRACFAYKRVAAAGAAASAF
jgi:hypothetical protein